MRSLLFLIMAGLTGACGVQSDRHEPSGDIEAVAVEDTEPGQTPPRATKEGSDQAPSPPAPKQPIPPTNRPEVTSEVSSDLQTCRMSAECAVVPSGPLCESPQWDAINRLYRGDYLRHVNSLASNCAPPRTYESASPQTAQCWRGECYVQVQASDLSCVDASFEPEGQASMFVGTAHTPQDNRVSEKYCYMDELVPRGKQKVLAFPTTQEGKHRVQVAGRGTRWMFIHSDSCYGPDIDCRRCMLDDEHPACSMDVSMMDQSWIIVEVFNTDPDDTLTVHYVEGR